MFHIRELILFSNDLTGPVPAELSNLSNLEWLGLAGNRLTGPAPSGLGNLHRLQGLNIRENNGLCAPVALAEHVGAGFEDPVCQDAAERDLPIPTPTLNPDLAALVALYHATNGPQWETNDNWLSDQGISEWAGVTTHGYGSKLTGRVRILYLQNNNLTGFLPPELGDLSELRRWLDLANNEITGSIPPELGNLFNLQALYLWDNRLTGSIPPELGNLSNLRRLDISNNDGLCAPSALAERLGDRFEGQICAPAH